MPAYPQPVHAALTSKALRVNGAVHLSAGPRICPTKPLLSLRLPSHRSSLLCSPRIVLLQDGALAFDDFMSLYVMQLKDGPNNEQEMLEAFQAFDKAGNGFIMVDDMKHVLTDMGTDRLTPEEADMMLKLADKDGDGVLNYEEIISVLTSDSIEK